MYNPSGESYVYIETGKSQFLGTVFLVFKSSILKKKQ